MALIFDFDGVIIDSQKVQEKAFLESYYSVVGENSPSIHEFFSHSGNSLKNIFSKMKLPLEMIPVYEEISRNSIHEIILFEGIIEVLETIKHNNIKCALFTGKGRDRTIEILNYFNLMHFFNIVVCSDDIKNPKPNCEGIITIMDSLKLLPERTYMIGDARNDIICAKNAGIKSIAVTWGIYNKDTLSQENPEYIVNNIAELIKVISELHSVFISNQIM
jgi:3-amino-5-hydroxybenzoic acid synthesis related protein